MSRNAAVERLVAPTTPPPDTPASPYHQDSTTSPFSAGIDANMSSSRHSSQTPSAGGANDSPTADFSDQPPSVNSISSNRLQLYQLLQVPNDASGDVIKKAYYDLARKYHPDKNINDEDATRKFQQLAEAYRVLSDPESRAVYDRYGDRGLVKNSVDMIDPSTLFAMVFGSKQFAGLIGELRLASLASNVDPEGQTPSEQVLNDIQRTRVGTLVLEMVKTLKPWVDGDKKGFLATTHRMMRKLKTTNSGSELLATVGKVYMQQAAYLLDKGRPFNLSAVMRKATLRSHRFASHHKAKSAANRVMEKQRKLHDRLMRSGRDGHYMSGEEARQIAVEMANNAIDMMWKISVIDIESTLEDVIFIVLSGRDLVAEDENVVLNEVKTDSIRPPRRGRRRLGSYLGQRDASNVGCVFERGDPGLARPLPPLGHGQSAITRQEILSERAYGIQAMGRVFISAPYSDR